MARYDFDVLVIGGGSAGLTVASGAARLGAKTLLAEREERLGGDCLHYGCVPSKTLIHASRVYHFMQHAENFGLPPVFPPPVEFPRLAARIREVVGTIQKHDSPERFCSLGAQVEFGPARFLDEHTVEVGEKRFTARSIVVATGSRAWIPDLPGFAETEFLTNRELFDLEHLPSSLIVLGGGAVACEMAQAFARLGSRVSLVQRSAQLLSSEDEDMAALVRESLAADSVVVTTSAQVGSIGRDRAHKHVVCDTDRGRMRVMGAEILVALGRAPNVSGLGLENAGVDHDRRGIRVDERMRTSRPHIFAAGDVTGRHQTTHAAGYEGGIVVANAVLRLPRKADYTFMPRCTFTDPELACVGMNEREAKRAGLDYSVRYEDFAENDRALAEGSGAGRLKLVLDGRGRPRGVQLAGPHAGELVAQWVALFSSGGRLTDMAGAVQPYPTLAEINKRAAGGIVGEKLFSPKVKKILQFLFSYRGSACSSTE
ncbi:MAG: NAD(P)/FAD-dependent oxidoreductase [Desulfovibrionaceae bacterium]